MKQPLMSILSLFFLLMPVMAHAGNDCHRAKEMVIKAYDLGHTPDVIQQQKSMLKEALILCPDSAEAHNNLGYLFETQKVYGKAIFHYKKALQNKSSLAEAWLGLGDVYAKTNRFPMALEAWLHICHEDTDARNRILDFIASDRLRITEAGEMIDRENLLIFFDKQKREKLIKKILHCRLGTRATMVPEITFRNIQFDLGSAKIRKTSIPQLNEIGAALQEINSPITISGHTDKQPFKGYTPQESVPLNLNLSKNRAKAVADFLINMGISGNRIKTHGFGSKNPVAHGNTDADYAKNRRVVIGVND